MRSLEAIIARRLEEFHAGRIQCAETTLLILADYYGWDNPMIPRVATALGGGIAAMQMACGAFTGGSMGIGMLVGRDAPGGDRAPAVKGCLDLHRHIVDMYGGVTCKEIVGALDFADGAQQAAFRGEGGKHQTVCEPLVASVCRYIVGAFPSASTEEAKHGQA